MEEAIDRIESVLGAIDLLWCDFFGGWKKSDIDLLRPYLFDDPSSKTPGELIDWIGVRTDLALHSWVERPAEGYIHLTSLPFPNDFIHAEAIEYIALAVALERARANGSTSFAAVELGASYGPWVTAAGVLAVRAGFPKIDLVAVEASAAAIAKITDHAGRNGLVGRKGLTLSPIHAAVHLADEPVYFPRLDVSQDNGGRTATTTSAVDYRGKAVEYDRVQGMKLSTLCRDMERIDFMHLDLQGAEEGLMQNVEFLETLDAKVATFFLATQSRLIEGIGLKQLGAAGWRLIRERPTTYQQNDRTQDVNGWTTRDGAQLWLNPRFGNRHFET